MQQMQIQGTEIQIKEYQGKRVVTLKDVDAVHQRKPGTASRNFRENRMHFIDGVDFYKINQPDEIRRLGISRPQGGTANEVTLITETGYLMLVKSFTDDLAWKVRGNWLTVISGQGQSQTNSVCRRSLKVVYLQ